LFCDAGQHRIAAFKQQALLFFFRQHAVGAWYIPAFCRWRWASYRISAEATETFSDCTMPIIGMMMS
jgi:hypothetical protein